MPNRVPGKSKFKDTMREYDMRDGVRGKYVKRFPTNTVTVTLDPM